jgi:hypothetical protein
VLQQVFQQGEFASGIVITFQVMAFTRVSPGNPDSIRTLPEAGQYEFGAHAAGAWNPDYPDGRGVFHAAYAGQVGSAIAAPVAQKTQDFRFVFSHRDPSPSQDPGRLRPPGVGISYIASFISNIWDMI